MKRQSYILGAGITGLAAGLASGMPVYEAAQSPGGICASYYIRPGSNNSLHSAPEDGEAYRFEIGGGHWIFNGDPVVSRFIHSLVPVQTYKRKSAVYLRDQSFLIPFPIQNHLRFLGPKVAATVLQEIMKGETSNQPVTTTMADWLRACFGPTLCGLFFNTFHELYTAGLYKLIAPQDLYKSPVDISLVIQGAFAEAQAVGYNVSFIYPKEGLNMLTQQMATQCDIHYGKRVVRIDYKDRAMIFEDGTTIGYGTLLSTLPLNNMVEITGITLEEKPEPATSVLVINIGASRGRSCPEEHWVYVSDSKAGFHRVGFYSNVDVDFLPASKRGTRGSVGIYVEKAYQEGQKADEDEVKALCRDVVKELQDWEWIEEVKVINHTWIDVAYTWSWPGSNWKKQALRVLEEHNIYQVGRYGRWVFQGIADSIRDGLGAGVALR